jgi:hypothetical protein
MTPKSPAIQVERIEDLICSMVGMGSPWGKDWLVAAGEL